jgi:outer membrane lipoprotein-sorting protein
MRLVFGFLTSLSLAAQPFPDGSSLLKQNAAALAALQSYDLTQVTTTDPMGMTMTMHMQSSKPGKMRMEMSMMGMGFTMVSDGTNAWMEMPAMKKFMKLPSEGDFQNGFAGLGFAATGVENDRGDAKVVRSESIEVEGLAHDCWVVEAHGPAGPTTLWIDKAQGFELQRTATMQAPGANVEIHSKTVTQSIKLNPSLPDSLFAFAPSPDFKETDELFPGMNQAMLKAAGVPAHTAPAHTEAAPSFVAIEPQAFVPSLLPLKQDAILKPVNGLSGRVEMLVSIDPAGNVANVEVLTGKEALRPVAIDAVRQWKFRPVIRDGKAVYAATQSSVEFFDLKTGGPADAVINIDEVMATNRRMTELMEKFPRSPQQELADLEQDRAGDAYRRSSALPLLAKSAFKAGAFDKAESYANEGLQQRRQDGDAVHDGNMVLGLIAMRQGNVEQAKHYLLESAKTKGSPVLGSFGPSMTLAGALFEKGERDAVLQYLQACRSFWTMGTQRLTDWTAAIQAGRKPDWVTLF